MLAIAGFLLRDCKASADTRLVFVALTAMALVEEYDLLRERLW